MTKSEVELLQRELDLATYYLEFGSGSSTRYAVDKGNLQRIDSVESSLQFVEECLLVHDEVKNAQLNNKLELHLVDIGPTGRWGFPTTQREKWPDYPNKVFKGDCPWDLVLVDGRFRVACALNIWLHCCDDVRVLIHDYKQRAYYSILLDFFAVIERCDTFVLLEKKSANEERVRDLHEKYQYLAGDQTSLQRMVNVTKRWLGVKQP